MTVKVNVARSPEEAELQAQGIDVMARCSRKTAPLAEELAPEAETEVAAEAEAAAEEAIGRGTGSGRSRNPTDNATRRAVSFSLDR